MQIFDQIRTHSHMTISLLSHLKSQQSMQIALNINPSIEVLRASTKPALNTDPSAGIKCLAGVSNNNIYIKSTRTGSGWPNNRMLDEYSRRRY